MTGMQGDVQEVYDFGEKHDGDVYLSHRWQKHVHYTSKESLIVAAHEVPPRANVGVTRIYRKPADATEFKLCQTLSDDDIPTTGDLNAGILIEDTGGTLYATGHSNPLWWTRSRWERWSYKLPNRNAKTHRTNVIYRSDDDGRTWSVLKDKTDHTVDDCPHPHNLYFDPNEEQLWWLVGHDGTRLRSYDRKSNTWTNRYDGTLIQEEDRLPLAMKRANGRLWLACEVSGPDSKQLFYSEDDGMSWTKVNYRFEYPENANNDGLWSIAVEPLQSAPDTLYVSGGRINTGQSFVCRSEDNGESWDIIYTGEESSDAWVTFQDGTLFIADGPNNLFYSTDKGNTIKMYFTPDLKNIIANGFVEPGIIFSPDRNYVVGKNTLYGIDTGDPDDSIHLPKTTHTEEVVEK